MAIKANHLDKAEVAFAAFEQVRCTCTADLTTRPSHSAVASCAECNINAFPCNPCREPPKQQEANAGGQSGVPEGAASDAKPALPPRTAAIAARQAAPCRGGAVEPAASMERGGLALAALPLGARPRCGTAGRRLSACGCCPVAPVCTSYSKRI